MFQTILLNAIIWLIICKMSFFCSKFTTIDKFAWFQNAVFALENFAEYKLKSEKLAKWVLNRSYSKVFSCRTCHCFWISVHLFFLWFKLASVQFLPIYIVYISALSYINYLMLKGLEPKKRAEIDNETLKNMPWTNSRSQYGNYEGQKLE
jgi:hypothetical protein